MKIGDVAQMILFMCVMLVLCSGFGLVLLHSGLHNMSCLQNLPQSVVLTRLALAFFSSVFFGLMRQISFKPVGFASYVIVCIGACALGMTVVEIKEGKLEVGLLAAGVTGIGFLGSGAFIKQKTTGKIHGFTNGACIWIFAVLGIALGLGEYDIFGLAYFLLLSTVTLDAYFERHSMGSYQKRLEIVTNKVVPVTVVEKALGHICTHYKLVSLSLDTNTKKMRFVFLVEGPQLVRSAPEKLSTHAFFESCAIGG